MTALRLASGSLRAAPLLLVAALGGAALAGVVPDARTLLALALAVHVLALSAVIARFCATNLRGQARLERFAALLVLAAGSLTAMVVAPSLTVAAVGWTLSGLAVAGLVHHAGTPASARAARRVLRAQLPGDAALWLAVVLLAAPDLPVSGGARDAVVAAALVVAVVCRGALMPRADWLADTAEAPSPVTALLHAGVVNGGVLLLVLHPETLTALSAAPVGAAALLVLAGATILLGSLAAASRPDVKGRLAGSTSAQMALATGFVVLGLPAAALLHVVAHAWWKAWSFLNAGGEVDRRREQSAIAAAGPRDRVLPAVLAAASGAVMLLLLVRVEGLEPLVAALPALLVAGLVGAGASIARRTGATTLGQVAALVPGIALGGIVIAAEHLVLPLGPGAQGAPGGPAHPALALPLLVGVVLAWVLAGHAVRRRAALAGPLALLEARLSVPAALRGRAPRPAVGPAVGPAVDAALGAALAGAQRGETYRRAGDPDRVRDAVLVASSVLAPAWPLRNAVATSPVDGVAHLPLEAGTDLLDRVLGRDPRAEVELLLAWYDQGAYDDDALLRAAAQLADEQALPDAWRDLDAGALVRLGRSLAAAAPTGEEATRWAGARRWTLAGEDAWARARVAVWCARVWGRVQVGEPADPWRAWLAAARGPGADLISGVRGLRALAAELPEDPLLALSLLHEQVGRHREAHGGEQPDLPGYVSGLLALAPGWAAHARWRESVDDVPGAVAALVALAAVHDLLAARRRDASGASGAPPAPSRRGVPAEVTLARHWRVLGQRALDLVVQDRLFRAAVRPEVAPASGGGGRLRVQSLWCLDARSAPVRRHLEAIEGPRRHRTFGVAGFFGAAVDSTDPDGTRVRRAPFLLAPDLHLRTVADGVPRAPLATAVCSATRDPRAVLGWAEIGGLLALAAVVADGARRGFGIVPRRRAPALPAGSRLDLDAAGRAARVAGLLRAAGIADSAEGVGDVLLVVGHGARTANNAYAAAYDCGACGANPGALNAALVAAWFNDPEVRALLRRDHGITLPLRATALAAWHDTTADVVTLDTDHPDLQGLVADLARATRRARHEREAELPGGLPVSLRGIDRAEAVPEWGLAGAHGLLLGRGRVTDPGTRWFQLDYDAAQDVDGALLRAALAGPGLVAAGIMSCYAASVRWPQLFGAGDKTLHNVVGDVGVQRGRDADLALGLPWQAVAASAPEHGRVWSAATLRHLPARPLLAVEGEREAVLAAVDDVPALRSQVHGGWVRLCVVQDGRASELVPRLRLWREVGSDRVVDVVAS